MESYVVIGGGLAGLTAANALAGPGRQVTLLEQSSHLGGRARTQQENGTY
jgi:phytoene dehydrogenase-like protein